MNQSLNYPPKTNTTRPILLPNPKSIRFPRDLWTDILNEATRRDVSITEVVLNAVENEFARKATYLLNYYIDIRPLARKEQAQRCHTRVRAVLRKG